MEVSEKIRMKLKTPEGEDTEEETAIDRICTARRDSQMEHGNQKTAVEGKKDDRNDNGCILGREK